MRLSVTLKRPRRRESLVLSIFAFLLVDTSLPFTITPVGHAVSRALRLTYNDMEDLEKTRSEFEALMKELDTQDQSVESESSPLLLTTAGRHRRRLEMDLLHSLRDSDEAIDEIMHLWMYESTGEDAAILQGMEDTCSDGLVEEEKALRVMIRDSPHWVEPRVRLATLLYYKGQTDASYRIALEALELKPWHFEVCNLLTMLALRQQDMGQALLWARQGLPALRPDLENKRRKEWVDRALDLAAMRLEEAEVATESALQKESPADTGPVSWQ